MDQLPRFDTGTGSNVHDLRTCRNFRQLPNTSGTSDGISPTTCGGQLPEDLPTHWQRARCLLWVSVGVASIERPVHRRSFESNPAGSAPAHGAPNSVLAMSKQILGNFYLFSHESSSGTVCSSIQKTTTDTLTNITDSITQYQFCTLDTTEQNRIGNLPGGLLSDQTGGAVHRTRTETSETRPESAPILTGGRGKIITKASPELYQNNRQKNCTKTIDK